MSQQKAVQGWLWDPVGILPRACVLPTLKEASPEVGLWLRSQPDQQQTRQGVELPAQSPLLQHWFK